MTFTFRACTSSRSWASRVPLRAFGLRIGRRPALGIAWLGIGGELVYVFGEQLNGLGWDRVYPELGARVDPRLVDVSATDRRVPTWTPRSARSVRGPSSLSRRFTTIHKGHSSSGSVRDSNR